MTKMTIELTVTEELRKWAANPAWKPGQVEVQDGAIVLSGTVHTLRQAFNSIAAMGLIDTPHMQRVVFAAYDPNGDRHQITSKDLSYGYCVAYREDGDAELAKAIEYYGTPECWLPEYSELLAELENSGDELSRRYAQRELDGAKTLQEYFEKKYAERVVPVQEKLKAGGFDKYIVQTTSWKFMKEDAEKRADQCRFWGRKDVVVLESVRE
jgi:hypothetical protein